MTANKARLKHPRIVTFIQYIKLTDNSPNQVNECKQYESNSVHFVVSKLYYNVYVFGIYYITLHISSAEIDIVSNGKQIRCGM